MTTSGKTSTTRHATDTRSPRTGAQRALVRFLLAGVAVALVMWQATTGVLGLREGWQLVVDIVVIPLVTTGAAVVAHHRALTPPGTRRGAALVHYPAGAVGIALIATLAHAICLVAMTLAVTRPDNAADVLNYVAIALGCSVFFLPVLPATFGAFLIAGGRSAGPV